MRAVEPRRIIFVCQHGAFRSRMAAAFFNAARPAGWEAVSAGLTPQSEVSERVVPLLAGTEAETFADLGNPRPLDPARADRIIAIDAQLDGSEEWTTDADTDEAIRDQIRARVLQLVDELRADQ
jgi:protein-tyrosine-phosphatase